MNNNFYIILLTGPAGSGKDTLFNILYEIYILHILFYLWKKR